MAAWMFTQEGNVADEKIDLEALARAIAPHLDGGTWQHKPQLKPLVDSGVNFWATISGPNGMAITLAGNGYGAKGRVEVRGQYPKPRKGYDFFQYQEERPGITVDPKRPAQALAKDIARRFIPLYVQTYNLHLERKAQEDAYLNRREGFIRVACVVLGTQPYGEDRDYTSGTLAPGVRVTVKASRTATLTLDVQDIEPAELASILAAVQELAERIRPA